MKTKLIYVCLLLLTFCGCNKTEEISTPLNPLLRTNGLYVAVKPGACAFLANHITAKEMLTVVDIIRFYPTGGGIMVSQNVPKGFVITPASVKEWFINFETIKKKYRDSKDDDASIETHMFTPKFSAGNSINFADYLTKSKSYGTIYSGKIYNDSLALAYAIYDSTLNKKKLSDKVTLAPNGFQTFKFYSCENN